MAFVGEDVPTDPLASGTPAGHPRAAHHVNAHPHGTLWLPRNDPQRNHREHESLRTSLEANGHAFVSDTDTEVLILIDEVQSRTNASVTDAVQMAEVEEPMPLPSSTLTNRTCSLPHATVLSSLAWAKRMNLASLPTPHRHRAHAKRNLLDDEEVAVMHRKDGLTIGTFIQSSRGDSRARNAN